MEDNRYVIRGDKAFANPHEAIDYFEGRTKQLENELKIVSADVVPNTITFFDNASQFPMLCVAPDGFYVRGVKLEQDEAEARAVFDALAEWLKLMGKI